jgi:hypothetical protein
MGKVICEQLSKGAAHKGLTNKLNFKNVKDVANSHRVIIYSEVAISHMNTLGDRGVF